MLYIIVYMIYYYYYYNYYMIIIENYFVFIRFFQVVSLLKQYLDCVIVQLYLPDMSTLWIVLGLYLVPDIEHNTTNKMI